MDCNTGTSLTVQGLGSPVPAALGAQAGPGTSSSNDCNVKDVDNLASSADNTTSVEWRRAFCELEEGIVQLLEFVKPRHNVHGDIKRMASSLHTRLMALAGIEKRSRAGKPDRAEMGTQTSIGPKESMEQRESDLSPKEVVSKKNSKKKTKEKIKKAVVVGSPSVEETPNVERAPPECGEETVNQWKTIGATRKKSFHSFPKHREALIVRANEGLTYAEILRHMKEAPELQDLGSSVVKIRKRATGDLLLEMSAAGRLKAEQFQSAVANQLKGKAEVKTLSGEVLLEIKDLDEVTTEEEIIEAFERQLDGAKERKVVVKSIRNAYGGTRTAVIAMPADLARKAVRMNKLRVGWVVCRIREKIVVTRCYRCWDFGHLARNCKGPDRSKSCHRCGGEGHLVRTCTHPPNCCLCEGKDKQTHATGSFKCPNYQKALRMAERNWKKKNEGTPTQP